MATCNLRHLILKIAENHKISRIRRDFRFVLAKNAPFSATERPRFVSNSIKNHQCNYFNKQRNAYLLFLRLKTSENIERDLKFLLMYRVLRF